MQTSAFLKQFLILACLASLLAGTFFGAFFVSRRVRSVQSSDDSKEISLNYKSCYDLICLQNNETSNKCFINSIQNKISPDEFKRKKPSLEETIDYRLPPNLKPYFYELKLKPYIGPAFGNKSHTTEGTTSIHFTCQIPTDTVYIHIKDLALNETSLALRSASNQTDNIFVKNVTYDPTRDFAIFHTDKECEQNNNYTLSISYTGLISSTYGLYRSSYKDPNDETRHLAITQFEPSDARRAFPCMDEPALKARFQLEMIRHKNFTSSLFNTPIQNTTQYLDDPDWLVDKFAKTVIMSTYLVGFVVSDFTYIEARSPKHQVLTQIVAQKKFIDDGEGALALHEATHTIDFFTDYFNMSYPLDKISHVGVPDFFAGAMENWGIVVYRNQYLMYNNLNDPFKKQKRICEIIYHEVSHQWFGNIVSPAWWNDLWLNEGFASWFEYIAKIHRHPEWRDNDIFFIEKIPMMARDSLETTHSVRFEVYNPEEIKTLFDEISYDKGASVIRMMNAFLSEKTFKNGLRKYLKKYMYKNADQNNLWEELTKQAHEDKTLGPDMTVKQIMDTWTLQKGYPVVQVNRLNTSYISISQKWFLLNPLNAIQRNKPSEYKSVKWYVPFTYTTKNELSFDFETRPVWLKPHQSEITVGMPADSTDQTWILGNLKHAGFYRVNYDEQNWKLIIDQLREEHTMIDGTSRAQLIDDAFNLGRAELIDVSVYLDIIDYLKQEKDYLVIQAAQFGLEYVGNMISKRSEYELYKEFYRNTFEHVLADMPSGNTTLTDEDLIKLDFQRHVGGTLCKFGHHKCVTNSRKRYYEWLIKNDTITKDTIEITLKTAIAYGNADDWHLILKMAEETQAYQQRISLIDALTESHDDNLLKLLLEKSTNESFVKKQDHCYVIQAIARNPYGQKVVLDFLDNNWEEILAKFGDVVFTLPMMVKDVFKNLNTQKDLDWLHSFIAKHPDLGPTEKEFGQVFETVVANKRWMDKYLNTVTKWLVEKTGDKESAKVYRLPGDLLPVTYNLFVQPHFNSTTQPEYFDASVQINFKCITDTNDLILHMKDLDLNASTLHINSSTDANFASIKGFEYTYESDSQTFKATLEKTAGFRANHMYSFYVQFKGFLKKDNAGFYRSSYVDGKVTKHYLVSQFECIEARKAFISFDEPSFKAKVSITVKHDSSLTAFSNMPVKSKTAEIGNSWVVTEFEQTPHMPLYSLGLVVADFVCQNGSIQSETEPDKTIGWNFCARENALDQIQELYRYSFGVLGYYERLFNSTFPLTKIDHVVVSDFSFGAMENWGVVIYKESLICYTKNKTQETHREFIARVTNHELAHMWFGNLVTMKWWDDLWLNEGFARYYDFMTTHYFMPEWNIKDHFEKTLLMIMQVDSHNLLQPVSKVMNTPSEINSVINSYSTYGKGSAVVRMLNYITGKERLEKALVGYFKKYEYKSVDQYDLWNTLEEETGMDIGYAEKMPNWTKYKGFPVVNVKTINSSCIEVDQKPFSINSLFETMAKREDDLAYLKQRWHIPFTYTIEKINSINTSFTNFVDLNSLSDKIIWLKPNDSQTHIPIYEVLDKDTFILANIDFAGYYRVNYEPENWEKIIKQLTLNRNEISRTMRAQLINDAFGLARAGQVAPLLPLRLSVFLSADEDYLPWDTFLDSNNINYYVKMLQTTEWYGGLQVYLSELVTPMYERLGWLERENENWLHKKSRNQIVNFACSQDVPGCVETSVSYLKELMKDSTSIRNIPKTLRTVAFCTAIRHGGRDEHEFLEGMSEELALQQMLGTSSDPSLKVDVLRGLLCTKDRWRLNKYLTHEFDNNADMLNSLAVGTNPNGNYIIWKYIKNHWDTLILDNKWPNMAALVHESVKHFNTQEQYTDFGLFYASKKSQIKDAAVKKFFENSILTIKSNIKWLESINESVANWITQVPDKEDVSSSESYRLPKNIKPYLYELTIKPYIGTNETYGEMAFTFEGQMIMYLTCVQSTNQIVFHAIDLYVEEDTVEVHDSNGQLIPLRDSIQYESRRNFMTVTLTQTCTENENYTLALKYRGLINEDLVGFYQSSYRDRNGSIVHIATTHFQPGEARRAFPCFDEPNYKARFDFTMIRHRNFSCSYYNSHLASSVISDTDADWFVDKFTRTVSMSTYLVGFVVSSFDTIAELSPKHRILIEVAARPDVIAGGHADYALNETALIIDYFADYFNVMYPLEKSTQIAVPDFQSGAMENWGIIIYRETSLLNMDNTQPTKRKITQIVSHELAHQWFGNLVTLDWWNDLWLNEGFASWVEFLGMNHTHPEWRSLDFFKVQTSQAMVIDSFESSHPVSVEVNDPSEISSLFDLISYFKGSSIIRMMNAFLTEKTFKVAIENYLNKYKYRTATQDKLWKELTKQGHIDGVLDTNLDIKEIMDTWTLQKGYPVVQIDRLAGNRIQIKQQWFLLNPLNKLQSSQNKSEYESYRWYVPFTYTTSNELNFQFEAKPVWLKPNQTELIIQLSDDEEAETTWILGNIKQAGYYRVNYDQNNWKLLIDQLHTNHSVIDSLSKSQLIEDSFNLGRAEMIDQSIFLQIIDYLVNETDPLPFQAAFNGLSFLDDMMLSDYNAYKLFKHFYMKLMEPTYLKYLWRDDIQDINEIDLQIKALEVMCLYGRQDCVDKSRDFFEQWLKENSTEYENEFSYIAICTTIKYGTNEDWFKLLEKIQRDSFVSMDILSCSNDLNLLTFALEQSKNSSFIRSQDETWFISAIADNTAGKRIAYDFVEENWNMLYEKYGQKSFSLSALIEGITNKFNSPYELKRVEGFVSQHEELGAVKGSFVRVIERIKTNIRWMAMNRKTMTATLAAKL